MHRIPRLEEPLALAHRDIAAGGESAPADTTDIARAVQRVGVELAEAPRRAQNSAHGAWARSGRRAAPGAPSGAGSGAPPRGAARRRARRRSTAPPPPRAPSASPAASPPRATRGRPTRGADRDGPPRPRRAAAGGARSRRATAHRRSRRPQHGRARGRVVEDAQLGRDLRERLGATERVRTHCPVASWSSNSSPGETRRSWSSTRSRPRASRWWSGAPKRPVLRVRGRGGVQLLEPERHRVAEDSWEVSHRPPRVRRRLRAPKGARWARTSSAAVSASAGASKSSSSSAARASRASRSRGARRASTSANRLAEDVKQRVDALPNVSVAHRAAAVDLLARWPGGDRETFLAAW